MIYGVDVNTDNPPKHRGMFEAFKASVSRSKSKVENDSKEEITISKYSSIKVLTRTGDIEDWSDDKILRSLARAFRAIEGHFEHIQDISARIEKLNDQQIKGVNPNALAIDHIINSYFYSNSFISGALKRTAASNAISIFKRLKHVTLSIIFTTTRNFSIQKDLSISA